MTSLEKLKHKTPPIMKKPIILTVFATALLLSSCGGDSSSTESDEAQCETPGGKKVSCEDIENIEKLEDLSIGFVSTVIGETKYAEYIATNEAILKEMEPLMASMANVIKADPLEKEAYYATEIEEGKANVAMWKQVLVDLEAITISASYEQDPMFPKELDEMIRFKNTTSSNINYLGGTMTYFDKDGAEIISGDVGMYVFHFDPEVETMAPGYEGTSDMGVNMTKEQRATISSITIEIDEIRYSEK
ncbi:MAG: hypothetical protein ACJASQ_003888 [Crocinitomicaceae bacterium]